MRNGITSTPTDDSMAESGREIAPHRRVLTLKAALGPTIVIVTHDMDSLWRVADRVVLVGDARLLAQGTMPVLARSEDPAVMQFFQSPRGRAAQASA